MKHKKLFISLTVILSFFAAVAIFLTVWFCADKYPDFSDNFNAEFKIPGLDDGAVPQGMGNCQISYNLTDDNDVIISKTQQYFFITAYMVDGSPSRIYVTGGDTGYIGYVTMKNSDGTDYVGHCGGIATNGTTVWVTGEGTVYVIKSETTSTNATVREIIEKALGRVTDEDGNTDRAIQFTASFDANCNADFCYFYDVPTSSTDRLYVGEFYRKGNYETDASHRITTPCGYNNTAFMYEYSTSSTSKYGLTTLTDNDLDDENKVPKINIIYSIPEKVQGFAIAGSYILFSQSYGLANSHITVYDKSQVEAQSTTYEDQNGGKLFSYNGVKKKTGTQYGVSLKIYYVDYNDENKLVSDFSIPSMSEGLCTVTLSNSTKVYVLFESAGKKYRLFVREQLKNVYSIRIKN